MSKTLQTIFEISVLSLIMPQKFQIFRFTNLNRWVTSLFYLPLVLLITSVTWDWSSVTSSDGDIPYNQEFTNFSTPQNMLCPRDLILEHEKTMFNMIINIPKLIEKKNKFKKDSKYFDTQICIKFNWYLFLHVYVKKTVHTHWLQEHLTLQGLRYSRSDPAMECFIGI